MNLDADALYNWLSTQGLDPDYREEETEIAVPCWNCQDDKPRLFISSDTGVFLCFHCGYQGSLLDVLKQFTAEYDEAYELRRHWLREDRDPFSSTPFRAQRSAITPFLPVALPGEYKSILDAPPQHFTRYLQRRGVSIELAATRDIGYCLTGAYKYRLIIPVVNDGQMYTWVGRTIFVNCPTCGGKISGGKTGTSCYCDKPIPKVLTPQGGKPRLALYNLDAVREAGGKRILVMEGVFDVLRRPQEAVAILGSTPSPTQISLLAGISKGREVVVCLDGDQAGRMGATKVADGLASALVPVRIAHLPTGADPGSLKEDELEGVIQSATQYIL